MIPYHFGPAEQANALTLVGLALAEDFGGAPAMTAVPYGLAGGIAAQEADPSPIGDATGAATIPAAAVGSARLVARGAGVVAGLPVAACVGAMFGADLRWHRVALDGDRVAPGDTLAVVEGKMRTLLAAERTMLNFVQRLSGVATLTARFVAEVAGTKAVILDTRKTTPGWRALEKYAVRCGGGTNHRIGLYDAILIKDNHLAHLQAGGDPIGVALAAARAARGPDIKFIEVEVDDLDQLDRALQCVPDIVLVDNLGPEALAEAVRRRDERAPGVLLEASGGITLATVAALARSGVDRISVGALTHSAPALDIGLDYDEDAHP